MKLEVNRLNPPNIFHFRVVKKNRKQKMNSNICELSYKSEKLLLPIDCINIDDLHCLFFIKREVLHIKVKIEDTWSWWFWDVEKCKACICCKFSQNHLIRRGLIDSLNISEMFFYLLNVNQGVSFAQVYWSRWML